MSLSNQKLALAGFAVAATCTILGRWGLTTPPVRERDVLMVFLGGFIAALSVARFFAQWRAASKAPAEIPPPPPLLPLPPSEAPPKTKS